MKKGKRERLERGGWKVGSVAEFLDLSDQEAVFVELKLTLARSLRERRQAVKLTQAQLAELMTSSQSRVAKMEAADPEVSVDLLVRGLLALGVTRAGLARIIGAPKPRSAA